MDMEDFKHLLRPPLFRLPCAISFFQEKCDVEGVFGSTAIILLMVSRVTDSVVLVRVDIRPWCVHSMWDVGRCGGVVDL